MTNTKKIFLSLITLTLITSCSKLREYSQQEENDFKHVRILNNDSGLNMNNCSFIKTLEIDNRGGDNMFNYVEGDYTHAIKELQFKSNKEGANVAVIDKIQEPYVDAYLNYHVSYSIRARIFKCN
ncbi:MAG: hypothetical protein U0457_11225 [Candidatus Sericytochromatia bacterium]